MAEHGITIRRVFDAPRERVWQEWSEPERFADWFGGPEAEVPLETVMMDVRPGGAWRATMFFGRDRRVIRWKGEYVEVVAPERLVLTFSDGPDEVYELVTVVLNDAKAADLDGVAAGADLECIVPSVNRVAVDARDRGRAGFDDRDVAAGHRRRPGDSGARGDKGDER